MKQSQVVSHTALLFLMGTLAVFLKVSSMERPLRGLTTTLLPLLKENSPYLLKGMDLSKEGNGAKFLPIQMQRKDLSGMDLREARFPAQGLRQVRMAGAHLARADFSCTALDQVDFSGADLKESRFDFSNCKPRNPNKTCLILDQQRLPCTILSLHLRGANLTDALLQGGARREKEDSSGRLCDPWLVIEGELEGARLDRATLRCVVLRNIARKKTNTDSASTTPSVSNSVATSPPPHSGISFQDSTLENVILERGNFVFSDFWKARIEEMDIELKYVDFGYTSLADLQCPSEGCGLRFWPTPARPIQLSLNVRGSKIRTNLMPSHNMVLLCTMSTEWTVEKLKPLGAEQAQPAKAKPTARSDSKTVKCDETSGLLVQNNN